MYGPWNLKHILSADVTIIGAGIVGLSTAYYLKCRLPELKISVLEKGALPDGASVKNAGFACYGSPSEILSDLDEMGWDATHDLIRDRFLGLRILRQTLGDNALRYRQCSASELFLPKHSDQYQRCLDLLPELNRMFASATGEERNFRVMSNASLDYGFQGFIGEVGIREEGQIDPGMMIQELLDRVIQAGIHVRFHTEVQEIEENGTWQLTGSNWGLESKQVILCTNGYTRDLGTYFNTHIEPGRTQVLLTSPISGLKWERNFHLDKGYFYLRNLGDRVLFGGGRNLDLRSENTDVEAVTDPIQSELERLLREHFLPGQEWSVEKRWSGILGLGENRSPVCERITDTSYVASRLGGMGVALGMALGKRMAEEIFNP